MSIEKIKERIKMIENNDFSTNEIIFEDINLSGDDINKFLDPKNKAAIKAASKGFGATSNVSSAHSQLFGGGARFSSSNRISSLPQNIQDLIKPVFTEMGNLNILPNDLRPNDFQPKNGYDISYRGNRLMLAEEHEISLQFTNKKMDVLDTMYVSNVGNFNLTAFNDLYNKLYQNSSSLQFKSVRLDNRNLIKIEF